MKQFTLIILFALTQVAHAQRSITITAATPLTEQSEHAFLKGSQTLLAVLAGDILPDSALQQNDTVYAMYGGGTKTLVSKECYYETMFWYTDKHQYGTAAAKLTEIILNLPNEGGILYEQYSDALSRKNQCEIAKSILGPQTECDCDK